MPYRNSLLAALLCGVCGCPAAARAQGMVTFTGGITYIAPYFTAPSSGTLTSTTPTLTPTSMGVDVSNLQYDIRNSSGFAVSWSASRPFTVSGGAFLVTPSIMGFTTVDANDIGGEFEIQERILDINGSLVVLANYAVGVGGTGTTSKTLVWNETGSTSLLQPGNYISLERALVVASAVGRISGTVLSFHSDYAASIAPAAPNDVPEPGSLAFLASLGLTGAGFLVRRRKVAHNAA